MPEINPSFEVKSESQNDLKRAEGIKRLTACLSGGYIHDALEIRKEFGLTNEDPEVKTAAFKGFTACLSGGDINDALEIRKEFGLTNEDPEVKTAALEGFTACLSGGYIHGALEIHKTFDLPMMSKDSFNEHFNNQHIPITRLAQIIDPEFYDSIDNKVKKSFFCSEIVQSLSQNKELTQKELLDTRVAQYDKDGVLTREDRLAWQRLSKDFGAKKIASFMGIKDRGYLHIAVDSILVLYRASDLKPKSFNEQILQQVKKDGGYYNESDAYDLLNAIGRDSCFLTEANVAKIKVYLKNEAEEDETMKPVWTKLEKQGVFADWQTLREVFQMIRHVEVLERIVGLTGAKKTFFKKLFLHPNVSTSAVVEFLEKPGAFFDRSDVHIDEAYQDRIKPLNYTEFEHLDLTPEELRDALVEGKIDDLQYFPPFEIFYRQGETRLTNDKLVENIYGAVGKRSEGIIGLAKNPTAVFNALKTECDTAGLTLENILKSPRELTAPLSDRLEDIIFGPQGMKRPEAEEYRAQIHAKSSPDGLIAGNDTHCCMPFGSGKQNVYMYNLGCVQMTIQKRLSDGEYRTIAQSVLTPDINLEQGIGELRAHLMSPNELLSAFIKKDLSQAWPIYMTADNIEVNKNHRDDRLLKELYVDFFTRYAKFLAAQNPRINQTKLIIGQDHSDLSGFDSEANTFMPLIPPGYSDNTGDMSYVLPLNERALIKRFTVNEHAPEITVNPQTVIGGVKLSRGVRPLAAVDALRVSYLEGKIYADNETLMEYFHRIANHLIAKDINNTVKGRANLSLLAEDEHGKANAYLLAYVTHDEKQGDYIYVADVAAEKDQPLAGGKVMKDFISLVKTKYPALPIFAEARASTSYPIIKKHAAKHGYEVEEVGQEESGGDLMHSIILKPKTS